MKNIIITPEYTKIQMLDILSAFCNLHGELYVCTIVLIYSDTLRYTLYNIRCISCIQCISYDIVSDSLEHALPALAIHAFYHL